MAAPSSGYALMQNGVRLNLAFETSPHAKRMKGYLQELRRAFNFLEPEQYGGVGRNPVGADDPHTMPGWNWNADEIDEDDKLACMRVREILGDWKGRDPYEEWLVDRPWLIPSLDLAYEVRGICIRPHEVSIVEVAAHPVRTSRRSVGFDLGLWASGNFSLICDTAIWPIWHPPDPNDFAEC